MPARIDLDELRLRNLIEVEQLQQWMVAEIFGVSCSTIEKNCKRLGLKTQRTGPRSGEKHTGWKGGRKIVKGYLYIYAPNHPNATKAGYVSEHRLVMERVLNRWLDPKETVHHKNGNLLDNSPENLEVFSNNGEHLHKTKKGQHPQWSQEGRERIAQGLIKRTNQIRLGIGVPQRNPQTGRWIAKHDKSSLEVS